MKNILIANIFGIGDVLFTTPMILNLKKSMEGVNVDYLCNARTENVLKNNPDIKDIFVYEKDEIVSIWKKDKKKFFNRIFGLFSAIHKKKI